MFTKLLTSICNTFSLKFSITETLNWKTVSKICFCRKKTSPFLLFTLLYYVLKPNVMIYKIFMHIVTWVLWRESVRSMCSTLLRMTVPSKKSSKGHRSNMFYLRSHNGLLANYSTRQVMQSKTGQTEYWPDNVEELQYSKHHYQESIRWLCHCFSCWHSFCSLDEGIGNIFIYNDTAVTVFKVMELC